MDLSGCFSADKRTNIDADGIMQLVYSARYNSSISSGDSLSRIEDQTPALRSEASGSHALPPGESVNEIPGEAKRKKWLVALYHLPPIGYSDPTAAGFLAPRASFHSVPGHVITS
jgi:hypothetical protein